MVTWDVEEEGRSQPLRSVRDCFNGRVDEAIKPTPDLISMDTFVGIVPEQSSPALTFGNIVKALNRPPNWFW